MPRSFKVKYGNFIGWEAVILSIALSLCYLPGSPSALIWPYEWAIFLGWMGLGVIFYIWARSAYGKQAEEIMTHEMAEMSATDTHGMKCLVKESNAIMHFHYYSLQSLELACLTHFKRFLMFLK